MREHKEYNEHKQPSTGETFFGLMVVVALVLAIWLFVDEPKNSRMDTVFEHDHIDTMDGPVSAPPEG